MTLNKHVMMMITRKEEYSIGFLKNIVGILSNKYGITSIYISSKYDETNWYSLKEEKDMK